MANEKLFDSQMEREINTLSIFLTTKAARTALTLDEHIQTRLLAGATGDEIRRQLTDDLLNNGRIFSEFRRAVKSTARGSVNRVRDASYFSEFEVDRSYRWSAVLVNTCPDCLDRHNTAKTWEEWEAEGLPRTGQTVCRENCHCVLVPDEYTEIEPIRLERK